MLGHVWNRCPPKFTERTFGESRRRGKVRKSEADVRPPVADGEAYRGKAVSRHASQTSRRGLSSKGSSYPNFVELRLAKFAETLSEGG